MEPPPKPNAVRRARAGQRFSSWTGAVYVLGTDGALRRERAANEPRGKAAVKRERRERRQQRLRRHRGAAT